MQRKLKQTLDRLYAQRSAAHLANDPLSFCHRYAAAEDREMAALVASSFAYGGVKVIFGTLERIFAEMGPSPRRYVERFDPARGLERFARFKHRFNDGRDLCALLLAARHALEEAGSLETFFLRGDDPGSPDLGPAMASWSRRMLALDLSSVFGPGGVPAGSSFPFLFPSADGGSACKRLCMLLRWLVRPADGIDLGLWQGVSPARLLVPVDTHIQRICRNLGLTRRRTPDLAMAREITAALRLLDPGDPVKYDFVLCHLGISEGCSGREGAPCRECPVAGLCLPEPAP
jgi:uncharacterized protein (TIGR02757 family)